MTRWNMSEVNDSVDDTSDDDLDWPCVGLADLGAPPSPEQLAGKVPVPEEDWVSFAEYLNRGSVYEHYEQMEGRLREAMEAAVLLAFELRRPAFSQPGPDGVWRSPLRDQQLEHRRQKHLETLFGCLELDSSDVADTGLRLPCEAILAFMLDHLSACQRSRSREVAWLARVTAGAQETERLVNRNDRDNPGPVLVTYPDPAFELHALAWRYRIAEEHGDGYSPAQASAEALDRLAMELARWADGLRVQAAAGSDREPGRPEGGTRWLLRQCRGDIDKVQKLYQDKGLPSPSRPTLRRALHRLKIQPVSDET